MHRQEDRLPETEIGRGGAKQAGQMPTAPPGSCWAGPNQCKIDGCSGRPEATRQGSWAISFHLHSLLQKAQPVYKQTEECPLRAS